MNDFRANVAPASVRYAALVNKLGTLAAVGSYPTAQEAVDAAGLLEAAGLCAKVGAILLASDADFRRLANAGAAA